LSKHVVDLLETVNTQAQDCKLVPDATRIFEHGLQSLLAGSAVWQSGQGIVLGKVFDTGFGCLALGHVLYDHKQILGFAIGSNDQSATTRNTNAALRGFQSHLFPNPFGSGRCRSLL
jgi:hypothetical protein